MMNRLVIVLLLGFGVMSASAQQRFGYLNTQELIVQMPEYAEAQKKHEAFQMEQQQKYQAMVTSYQTKEAEIESGQVTMTETEKQMLYTELQTLGQQIQQYEQTVPQLIQNHQGELIGAIVEKVQNAAKEVGAENGFIYIFDTNVLLYPGGGEDVTVMVKKKLGLL
jgi:outer membrane protein